jgi:mRNA interferase HigB
MHVISRKKLVEFWEANPETKKPLQTWLGVAKAAKWKRPADVRAIDPKASIIANNRAVFDILGGRYRLVTAIRYSSGVVFIRFVGTHSDYNRIDAERV